MFFVGEWPGETTENNIIYYGGIQSRILQSTINKQNLTI